MAKVGLQFNGWDELVTKLDDMSGGDVVKKAISNALDESKDYVTAQLKASIGHLPAGGRFSTGRTAKSLDTTSKTKWNGLTGEIHVGFNLNQTLTSIFLMYGTPRMKPVNGMKTAVYGTATKRKLQDLHQKAIMEAFNNG